MRHFRPSSTAAGPLSRYTFSLLTSSLLLAGGCSDSSDPVDPGPGNGDTPAVSGSVTHGGAGVGTVQVVLRNGPGPDQQATTGNDGEFRFQGLAAGSWELAVTPPVYFQLAAGQAEVRPVQVPTSGTATVSVTLEPVIAPAVQEIGALATSFSPNDVTVAPGTRIRWTNQSTDFHTITPSQHDEWERGTVTGSGATFEAVVNNPGVFNYICEPHQGLGMVGVVRVEVAP